MTVFKTDHEAFWAGEFGDEYIDRNSNQRLVASNAALFSKIVGSTGSLQTVIEFGANIGMNLRALRVLLPTAEFAAIEINARAAGRLREWGGTTVHETSILDYVPARRYDFAFIKGVLIHIDPAYLPCVYDQLEASAERYVAMVEYYNPTPVTVPYRGHQERLFKRDFAGEFMARHPTFKLRDYGFVYKGDPSFPQDDVTWFLMERRA